MLVFQQTCAHRSRFSKKYRRRGIFRDGIFYFAAVTNPSETHKSKRTPNELQKMGIAAALEMFVIARVKKEVGCEPELNAQ
jgi:hypothetical protein